MAESEYPVRYVAFLDILAFRELITNLNKDETKLSSVRDLLRDIHNPDPELFKNFLPKSDFRAQSISDAVAISAKMTPDGLAHMFMAIERLAQKLLKAGYLLRGAIAKGKVFHDHEMVFGEGVVRAYHYESKIALYPRIMLLREIVDDVNQCLKEDRLKNIFDGMVRRSKDGPQYLNVLRYYARIKEMKGDDPKRETMLATITDIRNHIQRRLDEAVDEPEHFKKVHWFADYWNEIFYGVDGLKRIEGPGLEILLTVD
jgi:hypothetical protein